MYMGEGLIIQNHIATRRFFSSMIGLVDEASFYHAVDTIVDHCFRLTLVFVLDHAINVFMTNATYGRWISNGLCMVTSSCYTDARNLPISGVV